MSNQTRDPKAARTGAGRAETEQKQQELRGAEPEGDANSGQNQNPGKGAPPRHLVPDKAPGKKESTRSSNADESLADGKGTENPREDAALIKEQIRSRDA